MSVLINDNGIYKEPGMIAVNDNGIWKEVAGGAKTFDPDMPIGTFYEDGYYAGLINVGYGVFALIVAPKSAERSLAWANVSTNNSGATQAADGLANSSTLKGGNYPAADYCLRYIGAPGSVFYLPSVNELNVIYRAFKPATTSNYTSYGANPDSVPPQPNFTTNNPPRTSVELFQSGAAEEFEEEYYFSSTQSNTSSAMSIHFGNGTTTGVTKTASRLIRPVRRIRIS